MAVVFVKSVLLSALVGVALATAPTAAQAAPAVSDPHYKWGRVTGTVYFNKQETQKLTSAAVVAAYALLLPEPFGAILAERAGDIAASAALAHYKGVCVEVKSTSAIFEYSGSAGDGYCR